MIGPASLPEFLASTQGSLVITSRLIFERKRLVIVVYPRPGEDNMPTDPPERKLQQKTQRRSPALWREVFRPFTGLFSLTIADMNRALAVMPDAFWRTFADWWLYAAEPLDLPVPDVYRSPSLDSRGEHQYETEQDEDGEIGITAEPPAIDIG